jgi:hypothetical protein
MESNAQQKAPVADGSRGSVENKLLNMAQAQIKYHPMG